MNASPTTPPLRLECPPGAILIGGDLHLGRMSAQVASAHQAAARAVAAWGRLVELALARKVSAVLLAGDVVDDGSRFWEAIGPLETGVRRLANAGIPTVAVAGNHDHEVLARLADRMDANAFVLLGRDGAWARGSLCTAGRPWLHLDGWSFPRATVSASPLDDYALGDADDAPILGLLHGDLGAATSRYAPLSELKLRTLPPSAWVVGHQHAALLNAPQGAAWTLVPGSPQALDAGETGRHGVWLLDGRHAPLEPPEFCALSSVWYDTLEIDVSGVGARDALDALLLRRLRSMASGIGELAGESLTQVLLRLRLSGRCGCLPDLRDAARGLLDDFELPAGAGTLTITSVDLDVLPELDLAAHARQHNALGALARLLLDLSLPEPSDETRRLIETVHETLTRVAEDTAFQSLPPMPITATAARERLAHQARALMSELVEHGA